MSTPLIFTKHALERLRDRWPWLRPGQLQECDQHIANRQADGTDLIRLEKNRISLFVSAIKEDSRWLIITVYPEDFQYKAWATPCLAIERRQRLTAISEKHCAFRQSMRSAGPRSGGGCRRP